MAELLVSCGSGRPTSQNFVIYTQEKKSNLWETSNNCEFRWGLEFCGFTQARISCRLLRMIYKAR